MSSLLFVRKVFQMTVISVVLVALITVIIALALMGSSVQGNETRECVPINLTVNVEPTVIRLQWSVNPCALGYQLVHYIDNEIQRNIAIPHPTNVFTLNRFDCTRNTVVISTFTLTSEPVFEDVTTSFTIGFEGEAAVEDLTFNVVNRQFEWQGPDVSERCQTEYHIEFSNGNTTQSATTSNEYYAFPIYACTDNKINITTWIGFTEEHRGAVTYTHAEPVVDSPLEHISTTPMPNGAHIQWNATQEGYNFCELYNFTFEIVNLEYIEEFIPPIELLGNFELLDEYFTNLEFNTTYSYQVCYFIGWGSDLQHDCTMSVEFITETILPPIVLDNYVDSSLTISWAQSTNRNIATGHSIIITPYEPIHFVPEYCNWDLEVIEESFPHNVTEFVLSNVAPSFMYHVDVTTYFGDLGLSKTNYSVNVTTGEALPGLLDIHANFDYVPATPYDVTLQAQWDIPCDINGNVKQFFYTLEGVLKSASTVICDHVEMASGIIEVDEPVEPNGTVTFDIPGLLPFFDYYLTITTSLENFTNYRTIQLEDVPQAYSPPS